MRCTVFTESGVFGIPNDCNMIWVSGCGAGQGGYVSSNANGASGGAASPCYLRVPLSVTPGGGLAVKVGVAAAAATSPGSTSTAFLTGGEAIHSAVSGQSLISPLCNNGIVRVFSLGYGEGGVPVSVGPDNYGKSHATNATGLVWPFAMKTMAFPMAVGASKPDTGATYPTNPFTYGLVGRETMNSGGIGMAYANVAPYASGGPGGGGLFGKGGAGGVSDGANPGAGQDATGYGAGGGGTSGGPAGGTLAGRGSHGIVYIEY